ncbi:acyl-CoA reductase [Paraherbaspirillum soli]|uniref:long-chain-fatty-acyl-CoA reductase n=1 Tax=Paraherbaspirillum soli TaxID=631222 RepID=A0ABW0MCM2_9BURK
MFLAHGTMMPAAEADQVLTSLQARLPTTLAARFDGEAVLACAERFSDWVLQDTQALELDAASRAALHAFCRRDALVAKLQRELGETPFSLRRIDYRSPHFESWRPLGLVVHITPGNAPLLAFFAMLESLLVGNVNWLRPSSSDDGLTARLLAAFLSHDSSGTLADYLAVLPLPGHDLSGLFRQADAISAWGGHTALAAIQQQVPAGCRWIDWGHRISFAYLTPDAAASAQQLDALADEVCRLDQQACSSPQCVLVDSDDPVVLRAVGEQLAAALSRRSQHWPALVPSEQEAAEISTQTAFARLDQSFAGIAGHVWQENGWRIIWAHTPALAGSPLFRTVQLRPLPRAQLVSTLQPWRTQLQTCGLIVEAHDLAELNQLLLAAGVSRVTPAGAMHDGYDGEPHDGVYALARLTKRVSVSLPADMLARHATLDLPPPAPSGLELQPIMDKAAFQQNGATARAQLFFRSGGSSGEPKLAGFSYRDYHRQMQSAADGLFAAGLDPANDRVINLLYGGNLYGGLLSFFTILDKMSALHFPMGGPNTDDCSEIARLIVDQKINTLIGMPGTIHRLFVQHEALLREYGGVRKILLGGEHLNDGQRQFLSGFGIPLIRSAMYGSVDAGPLGHACGATGDGIFHLLADTQWLEIADLEHDRAAEQGAVGRLLFTSRAREGQTVTRYDLGDLGRWVPGPCSCGLPTPRFELCGRHGQLIRVGTIFLNPAQLAEQIGVPVQFLIDHTGNGRERIRLQVDGDVEQTRHRLLQDTALLEVLECGLLELEVVSTPATHFKRHPQSGKTPLLLDRRLAASHDSEM